MSAGDKLAASPSASHVNSLRNASPKMNASGSQKSRLCVNLKTITQIRPWRMASLGLVVALSVVLVVVVGTVVGSMLPLLLHRVGFDPAVASSPFVASIVDVTGIIVYFTVARSLLGLA